MRSEVRSGMAANKENLPPPPTPGRNGLRGDNEQQCTPPAGSSPGALGLRPWQMSAFASPPLRAMSPNSKPALSRQRDHSACSSRRGGTSLKVQKTRENLKDASSYPDIPPPCHHMLSGTLEPKTPFKTHPVHDHDRRIHTDTPLKRDQLPPALLSQTEPTESTLLPYPTIDYANTMPPPSVPPELVSGRMQRHKSVSRRMLSKVKQGISNRLAAKASTPFIRPVESETSLLRRISGRRKHSAEVERRTQSFEISRHSLESAAEDSAADEILAGANPATRSFTDSTVSTTEVLGNAPSTPNSRTVSSSSPQVPSLSVSTPLDVTPRPPFKQIPTIPHDDSIELCTIPYVGLAVSTDRAAVDAGSACDVWVAIEATVCSRPLDMRSTSPIGIATLAGSAANPMDMANDRSPACQRTADPLGSVTSLRLCFKPADDCRLLDVVGQKTLKDLKIGQMCSLFVKVRIDPLECCGNRNVDGDSASLYAEIESIVGTLETDVLHVEARYRHSLLPTDNVVTVRHTAAIRRPKTGSRWSIVGAPDDLTSSDEVHTKLAIHLADHYPPERALKLISRCLGNETLHSDAVRQVRQTLFNDLGSQTEGKQANSADKPSFVITDIDTPKSYLSSASAPAASEHFSTAPCTPLTETELHTSLRATTSALTAPPQIRARSTSLNALLPANPLTLTTTTDPTISSSLTLPATSAELSTADVQDSARKLWRHIRHSSLSAKQVAELAAVPLQQLEADDDALKELRRKALANKRSVGAETLKDWKWSGKVGVGRAEAPWL